MSDADRLSSKDTKIAGKICLDSGQRIGLRYKLQLAWSSPEWVV